MALLPGLSVEVTYTICDHYTFETLPADTLGEEESFHDLHTWMTSSYMTYITCYTCRLLPMPHPNREGQHITGV